MSSARRWAAMALAMMIGFGPAPGGMRAIAQETIATDDQAQQEQQEQTPAPTDAAEPTPTATAASTPTATATSTPTATETPTETAAPTATAAPTPAPAVALSESLPTPDAEWTPQGEAYTQLDDGTRLDGSLQGILDALLEREASADIFIMTRNELRITGIPEEQFERVRFFPDEEAFNPERNYYVVRQTLESEAEIPPVLIFVTRDDEQDSGEATPGEAETPTPDETETPAPDETETPAPTQTNEPTPAPTPTPAPQIEFSVEASDLVEGAWSNIAPTFTLSGVEADDPNHVYVVFICDERLILLSQGNNQYTPQDEGEVKLRFAVLDLMGDVVALSREYVMLLDFTPPDGPYLSAVEWSDTVCMVETEDYLSGLSDFSTDFGETWEDCSAWTVFSFIGDKGSTVEPGEVMVRDVAGNISANMEEFTFGRLKQPTSGGSGGKRPSHARESMDYSIANYNALELEFGEHPTHELVAGGTALNLSLTGEDGKAARFTAALDTWQSEQGITPAAPNALVLTAEEHEDINTWRFSGDVYRLLYNSGVDYMVLQSGEYIAAIPTEGFTGGTQYGKLKAGGVSTKKFEYTVCQDEALRETLLFVAVDGQTYALEEDQTQPMYRYNVLIGDRRLMQQPYESYIPEKTPLPQR